MFAYESLEWRPESDTCVNHATPLWSLARRAQFRIRVIRVIRRQKISNI